GEEDRVRPHAQALELAGKPPLTLGQPLAARWANARVDEDRPAAAADQEGAEREAPPVAVEELRVALAPRRPFVLAGLGESLCVGRERALRIEERVDLEVADYHRTRGGAGSPWPSCHEITGLRRTPIFSISASITSPGLRYREAASWEKPATPDT